MKVLNYFTKRNTIFTRIAIHQSGLTDLAFYSTGVDKKTKYLYSSNCELSVLSANWNEQIKIPYIDYEITNTGIVKRGNLPQTIVQFV